MPGYAAAILVIVARQQEKCYHCLPTRKNRRTPPYVKAAVNNFTQWLATSMATEDDPNIRANAIAPGIFLGTLTRFFLMSKDDTPTQRGQFLNDHNTYGAFW